MADKNPFESLGFNEPFIRLLKLNESAIFELIKSHYRTLAKQFHPEGINPNPELFKQATEAYDQLDRDKAPRLFRRLKEDFLKRSSPAKKILELQQKLKEETERHTATYSHLVDYLQFMPPYSEGDTIFNIAPCTLSMIDEAERVNLEMKIQDKRFFYNLILDKEYHLTAKKKGQAIKYQDKGLIGTISEKDVYDFGGIWAVLKKTQKIWTPQQARYSEIVRKIDSPRTSKNIKLFNNRIDPADFKSISNLVYPTVKDGSYLWSINREDGHLYFSLEGKVLGIQK